MFWVVYHLKEAQNLVTFRHPSPATCCCEAKQQVREEKFMVSLERFSVAKMGRFRCELGGWLGLGLGCLDFLGVEYLFFPKTKVSREA